MSVKLKCFVFLLLCLATLKAGAQAHIYRAPVQIYGHEEGAVVLHPDDPWRVVTKTMYTPIESMFGDPVPAGYSREYYLLIKSADNYPGCGNVHFRFWYEWQPSRPGAEVVCGNDWGQVFEGSMKWVQIPNTTEQWNIQNRPPGSGGNHYWRLEAKTIGCTGAYNLATRISAIFITAIDKPIADAHPPQMTLNTDERARPGVYGFGGTQNPVVVDDSSGFVGIWTERPRSQLAVKGTITAQKVKVTQNAAEWPDYVFHSDYRLPDLDSAIAYAKTHKHLQDVPSAETIEKEGHDLGNINMLLLRKIEELTLYLGEQKSVNNLLMKRVEELEKKVTSSK
ncbi:hypothetical protein SAMN05444266_110214 [Chitinophaga jiangningensis]|uniref:Uncharacterized protein n=1 Tax=Chitinophaga jiangningensis TaxID=1419482 RepID=A0A1M7L9E0_9BACT|nr:hypothetical protein [Chitinophaga jiangningensis]SHM74763.1 hypothetical protein SAMN05444266_110214 [Chitinophaga jiangningensis]